MDMDAIIIVMQWYTHIRYNVISILPAAAASRSESASEGAGRGGAVRRIGSESIIICIYVYNIRIITLLCSMCMLHGLLELHRALYKILFLCFTLLLLCN
jgi:hypothetical protein